MFGNQYLKLGSTALLLFAAVIAGGCTTFPTYQPATKSVQPPVSPMATVARLTAALSRHGWRDHLQVPLPDEPTTLCQYRDNRNTRVFEEGGVTESAIVLEINCDSRSVTKRPVTLKWISTQQIRQQHGYSYYQGQYANATWAAYYLYQLSLVPADVPGAFEAKAQAYRDAATKPQLPESAREFKVRGDSAVAEKRFLDAVEAYGRALQIAPWWPDGHFNVALQLSELKTYGLAVEEMQRYLALVPEATNARQAQDRIYAWRGKLEKPY
ncbi:MAG: hypothetical protein NUV63_03045 [Gallionella sp.]|nr:hypothetical protein [Gallionella sp.]